MIAPANPLASSGLLPTRIISYAWGDSYSDELLTWTIPALLAPGNLPALVSQVPCEVILVTEERLFAKFAAHPSIAKLRKLCPVRLIGLDDLITDKDKYGIALTFVLHRAFADLGPAMTDYWLVFLNADFVLADGSLKNLVGHLMRGERIVASPSYCTVKEDVIPELKLRLASDPTVLSLPPREMARLILRHRHNTIRGMTVNDRTFHSYYTYQFYWLLDDLALLGRQMPVAIVGLRPQRYLAEPNSLWDHGLMREFCPNAEIKLIGDSDEFLMLELRGREVAKLEIVPGPPRPIELAERMMGWLTPYQASFAYRPLILHADDLPSSTMNAQKQLDKFVTEVISHLPKSLPSHLNHPQWEYHWPAFMKARHAALTKRLGDQTELEPPPQLMINIDQRWWQLDGAEKALARKKRLCAADRDRKIGLLIERFGERARQTKAMAECHYAGLILPEQFDNRTSQPSESEILQERTPTLQKLQKERMQAAEESNRQKVLFREAIARVEREYLDRLSEFISEENKLRTEYDALFQARIGSAGIPVLKWRLEYAPEPAAKGGLLHRIAASFYRKLFGRWPHVTILSPFWSSAQPLLRAISKARTGGIENVLFVGQHSEMLPRIGALGHRHACASLADVLSPRFDYALDERHPIDLCLVELEAAELVRFAEIACCLKPHLRPGGTIIGFHMDAGRPLLEFPPPSIECEIVFAGSEQSIRAIAQFSRLSVRAIARDLSTA